jgi:hypothetical protein
MNTVTISIEEYDELREIKKRHDDNVVKAIICHRYSYDNFSGNTIFEHDFNIYDKSKRLPEEYLSDIERTQTNFFEEMRLENETLKDKNNRLENRSLWSFLTGGD